MIDINKIKDTAPEIFKIKCGQLKFLKERPDFHPEKSTYEHIKIVTNRLLFTSDINLVFSGLLHDICKFESVRENIKTGHPMTPGHEYKAYKLILENKEIQKWITKFGGDYKIIAEICKEHTKFKCIDNMREFKRISYIDYLKELDIYEKLNIFSKADDMINDFCYDGKIDFSKKTKEKNFYIVRGLPGSGKTTFAKHLQRLFSENTVYFEADMFFMDEDGNYNFDINKLDNAHNWCKGIIEASMKATIQNIILSNTSVKESELSPYIKLAKENNYKIFSIILENRHDNTSIHNVSDKIINRMNSNFKIKLK